MPADLRRRAILDATRPLLLQHGPDASTRQIAEACGIAEGTIYRVFDTKQELVAEAVAEALSPDLVLATIDALPGDLPVPALVVAIVDALQQHALSIRALAALIDHPPLADAGGKCPRDHRHTGAVLVAALEERLAARADELRVPPRSAAGAILAVSFGSTFVSDASVPTPDAVAHLLLHGISRPATDKDPAC